MRRAVNRVGHALIFWLTFGCALWLAGFIWFMAQIPDQREEHPDVTTDAIVVLTGGSGRLEHGLQLLAEGKGKKLFISGVGGGATVDDVLRSTPAKLRSAVKWIPHSIVIGGEAENTIGNAEETARWVKAEGYDSIRLVTADYHMPRAVIEMTQTLPGVAVIADPVFTADAKPASWLRDKESRGLILGEYHKLVAGKIRHFVVRMSDKIDKKQ